MSTKVTVYRFKRFTDGREISPQHMLGTLEAIALLAGCVVIEESARVVEEKLLEGGFYFEDTKSIFTTIEVAPPAWPDSPD